MIKQIKTKSELIDIFSVFETYFEIFRKGSKSRELFAEKIYGSGITIALYREELIGFSCFYCNDYQSRTAYISLIAVKQEYEHKGYGTRLLEEVKKTARDRGMTRLRLEVRKNNDQAISFYRKKGFIFEQEMEDSFYVITEL